MSDLLNKITDRVKAILVTHFLGFPQPVDEIKKICSEKNLFLIEDCAHALLSYHDGKPLGSYGDVSIFSLLKTLAVPNGGVLVINNKNISYNRSPKKPNFFATSYYAAELLNYRTQKNGYSIKKNNLSFFSNAVYISLALTRLMLIAFRKYFGGKGLSLVKPDSYLFLDDLRSWGISTLTRTIIERTDFEAIKVIRRRNFKYLLDYFIKNERGILPFKELPAGVCPLFFPIIVENIEKRKALYEALKNRRIITHPWWDRFHPTVPWVDFPDAVYLKQRLFGIPIHQDLTLEDLDYVLQEFESVFQKK
jgi:dTDP-4-amino-4,6-dideoxygalactose transaminase